MKPRRPIFYFYPMFTHVSWNSIAEKHLEHLEKYFRIYRINLEAFPFVELLSKPLIIVHPYFYVVTKWEKHLVKRREKMHGLIGFDVADSDKMSKHAVKLSGYASALIVPSNFSKKSYVDSGVKVPVHVVPHGVDEKWLDTPPLQPQTFKKLSKVKKERRLKLILGYFLHSPYRKGLDLFFEFFKQLYNERKDVCIVLKTMQGVGWFFRPLNRIPPVLEGFMNGLIRISWLTEQQQMELFDICDMYFLSSRGGGFEHPPFLGMCRGEVVIGAKGCSWDDWLPEWALIPSKPSKTVLEGNPIHVGRGVEVLMDKAVDKAVEILDNLNDYKARVKEHLSTHVRENFTWKKICPKIRDIILRYL